VFYLTWEIEQVREIALRHIHQAVEEKNLTWNKLINNGALSKMEKFLTEVYEGVAPAGWLALAESILFLANRSANAYSLPLTDKHLNELKRAVYQRHIPIRLDPSGPGIWRGPEYIPLTKKPFQFLEAVQRRTGSVRVTDEDLLAVAGTSGNIHSLASRTRSLIEPFPKKPVYLVNRSGEGGYQLENSIY
jgi:hypothetical protein